MPSKRTALGSGVSWVSPHTLLKLDRVSVELEWTTRLYWSLTLMVIRFGSVTLIGLVLLAVPQVAFDDVPTAHAYVGVLSASPNVAVRTILSAAVQAAVPAQNVSVTTSQLSMLLEFEV